MGRPAWPQRLGEAAACVGQILVTLGLVKGTEQVPAAHQAPGTPTSPIPRPPKPAQPGDISLQRQTKTSNSTLGFPQKGLREGEQEAKRFLLPKTSSQKGTKLFFFLLIFASKTLQIIKKREPGWPGEERGGRG